MAETLFRVETSDIVRLVLKEGLDPIRRPNEISDSPKTNC